MTPHELAEQLQATVQQNGGRMTYADLRDTIAPENYGITYNALIAGKAQGLFRMVVDSSLSPPTTVVYIPDGSN